VPVPLLTPRLVTSSHDCGWSAAADLLVPRDPPSWNPEIWLGNSLFSLWIPRIFFLGLSGVPNARAPYRIAGEVVPSCSRVAESFGGRPRFLLCAALGFFQSRHQISRRTELRLRIHQPGVDNARAAGLYTDHTVRRRLGAMTRLRSSSLIFGDQPPIASRRFGASTALWAIRGGDLLGSGLFDK